LLIYKIAAFRGNSYFADFVYVQCIPDKPIGLYKHNKIEIEEHFNKYGEYREGFGVFKRKFISSQEYHDGFALIKGKPVEIEGAIFRTRNMTKYNFIIAAKFSPYNCNVFYRDSDDYFIKLLKGELEFESFVTWMRSFPKNMTDY